MKQSFNRQSMKHRRERKDNMTKLIATALAVAAAFTISIATASAKEKASKEMTITGNAMCAKCQLKQTADCQTAIQVEKGKKTLTYYLIPNDVSKSFHE